MVDLKKLRRARKINPETSSSSCCKISSAQSVRCSFTEKGSGPLATAGLTAKLAAYPFANVASQNDLHSPSICKFSKKRPRKSEIPPRYTVKQLKEMGFSASELKSGVLCVRLHSAKQQLHSSKRKSWRAVQNEAYVASFAALIRTSERILKRAFQGNPFWIGLRRKRGRTQKPRCKCWV